MKKLLTILAFTTIFILTGCNKASDEENTIEEDVLEEYTTSYDNQEEIEKEDTALIKSLSGFLEYNVPKDWQETEGFYSEIELSSKKEDVLVSVEYLKNDFEDPNERFEKFDGDEMLTFKYDTSRDDDEKQIMAKVYGKKDDVDGYEFINGIIKFEGNDEIFLNFLGTSVNNENGIQEILNFLDTITLTDQQINQERVYISEDKTFELALPAGWRLQNYLENSFYKEVEEGSLFGYMAIYSKKSLTPEEGFENLIKLFEANFANPEVYIEENTQKVGNKTITSKVYKYVSNGNIAYTYFNIVDIDDEDVFFTTNYDLVIQGDFEDYKDEFDYMTNSIAVN